MSKQQRIEAAVVDLRRRIVAGEEWPDASAAVAVRYRIDQEELSSAYDEADADELEDAARQ